MLIDKISINKTIKAGDLVWVKGTVLNKFPFHPVLLEEIKHKTGTVEVLSYKEEPEIQGETSTVTTLLTRSECMPIVEEPLQEPSKIVEKEETVLRPRRVIR